MTNSAIEDAREQAAQRVRMACKRIAADRKQELSDLQIKYVCGYRRTFVFQTKIKTHEDSIDLFIKAGRNLSDSVCEFVSREANLTAEVRRRFPATETLDVVTVEAFYPDLAVLATRAIPGSRLDQQIVSALRSRSKKRMQQVNENIEKCGEWLRSFQKSWPQEGEFDVGEMLIGINRQIDTISKTSPDLMPSERADVLRDSAFQIAGRLPAEDRKRVTRHDDYAPWNVICDARRLVVFDFPNVQPGPVHHDLYQFDSALATLQNKPLIPKQQLHDLRHRFRLSFDRFTDETAERDDFYSLHFGLVRLGALLHLHKPRFPKNLLIRGRIRHEMESLMSICNGVRQS